MHPMGNLRQLGVTGGKHHLSRARLQVCKFGSGQDSQKFRCPLSGPENGSISADSRLIPTKFHRSDLGRNRARDRGPRERRSHPVDASGSGLSRTWSLIRLAANLGIEVAGWPGHRREAVAIDPDDDKRIPRRAAVHSTAGGRQPRDDPGRHRARHVRPLKRTPSPPAEKSSRGGLDGKMNVRRRLSRLELAVPGRCCLSCHVNFIRMRRPAQQRGCAGEWRCEFRDGHRRANCPIRK